jgi:iron complex outermembrane receptor protein
MKLKPIPLLIASAVCVPLACAASDAEQILPEMTVSQTLPAVVVNNPSPSAEVTQDQIREINVINVEDSLKFAPSIFIRKRYVGDRNGIIASRTAGSLQSAWSLVYADGLLVSNLLGNSYNFPPRWNIVGSEEIENIEVMYGPFSALLPGNSAGATILITTHEPKQFEAHARVQGWTQGFQYYGTDDTYQGHQEQAVLGSRYNNLSWSFLFNHMDSHSQPINFATAPVPAAPSGAGKPVTGGVAFNNPTNVPSMIFGATSLDHTVQDTAKIRLSYDFTPDTHAALTYAFWQNDSFSDTQTYLKNAAGQPIWSGSVKINGYSYNVSASALAPSDSNTQNQLVGLSMDSRLSSEWKIELEASNYTTPTDVSRTPTTAVAGGLGQPGSAGGGGKTTFGDGTGWDTFDARAVWKPLRGAHDVTFGYHYDHYQYSSTQYTASSWRDDGSLTTKTNQVGGDTRTDALFVQDAWKLDQRWTLTLGWRAERWQASDGSRFSTTAFKDPSGNNVNSYAYPSRSDRFHSPKIALAWKASSDWLLRGSVARAYRMPTVTELFQTETRATGTFVSDPSLEPEKILATDLTAEHALRKGNVRFSLFDQHTDNFLTSQTSGTGASSITSVQNIGRTRISGAEAVYEAADFLLRGLDFTGSLTYTDSEILSDPGNPAIVGKKVPRIPDWRMSAFASYRFDEHWSGSIGILYSGLQYGNLDNSDTNHDDTGSLGKYATADLKLGYRFSKLIRASLGIDNLTNETYFIGPHPFPQRTYHAELRVDY